MKRVYADPLQDVANMRKISRNEDDATCLPVPGLVGRIRGRGKLYVDDLQFRVVDEDVPVEETQIETE